MMPGRLVAFHCMNVPATIEHDGFIGIKDFRGDLIRARAPGFSIFEGRQTKKKRAPVR